MDAEMTISEVLEQFFELTGISAYWAPLPLKQDRLFYQGFEPAVLCKYLDFDDVEKFISQYSQQGDCTGELFHTLYTRSSLIYNILFTHQVRDGIGAFITGPVLLYPLTTFDLEYMLKEKKLRQSEKQYLLKIIIKIVVSRESKLTCLGRYMAQLVSSGRKGSFRQVVHRVPPHKPRDEYHKILNAPWPDLAEEENPDWFHEIRDAILQGNSKTLKKLLLEKESDYLHRLASFNRLQELKNECIKLSALCCSWAVEGKADSRRSYLLLDKSVEEIDNRCTTHDMARLMKTTLLAYTSLAASSYNMNYSKHINNLLHYINNNYTGSITLNQLAERAGLNPNYLSNLIRRETGLSLIEIVNKTRIDQSKYLLLDTNMTILQVAQAVGFNYHNYFSSIFKKLVGMTPNEYRLRNGRPM